MAHGTCRDLLNVRATRWAGFAPDTGDDDHGLSPPDATAFM